jgi:hypothetical protein
MRARFRSVFLLFFYCSYPSALFAECNLISDPSSLLTGYTLIDSRNQKNLARTNLFQREALQIPLEQISAKAYLKDKKLLLITELQKLELARSTCQSLLTKGFRDVDIFYGLVEEEKISLPLISASELLRESKGRKTTLYGSLKPALELPNVETKELPENSIELFMQLSPLEPQLRVIITTKIDSEPMYVSFAKAYDTLKIKPFDIFFLKDGVEALTEEIDNEKRINDAKAHEIRSCQ